VRSLYNHQQGQQEMRIKKYGEKGQKPPIVSTNVNQQKERQSTT
jgi:hypothetical protein